MSNSELDFDETGPSKLDESRRPNVKLDWGWASASCPADTIYYQIVYNFERGGNGSMEGGMSWDLSQIAPETMWNLICFFIIYVFHAQAMWILFFWN
jgi:hypothetical protein